MKRYKHNLSNYQLRTGDMGELLPIGLTEVLPSDTIQDSTRMLIRVSPLAAPVMHHVTARVHKFFVPTRLAYEKYAKEKAISFNWEDFITGGEDGAYAEPLPKIVTTADSNNLFDYFGIPNVPGIPLNVGPIAAFNLVWNEFFRDQDIQPVRDLDDLTVPLVAWEKDYLSVARAWTQRGPQVTVPVGGQAPVVGLGTTSGSTPDSINNVRESDGNTRDYANRYNVGTQAMSMEMDGPTSGAFPKVFADLAQAEGVDVNEYRKSFAIQRYQEARARYGARLSEYLRYMGAFPEDSRLQRPEFLSGGSAPINFSEVLQTAPETGVQPTTDYGVGDMYGHGVVGVRSNKYRKTFPEHGFVITVLSVRPMAVYSQGIDRHWLYDNKEDWFQKELEYIGQQEVYNNEVYADAASGMQTFGYNDRYSHLKFANSRVANEYRNVLDYYHLARIFSEPPVLNESFIACKPSKRIHNVQTNHVLWVMAQHRTMARRIVSKSSMPRIF